MRKRIILLKDEQIEALEQVLEYLQEEAKDYYEACTNGEDTSNHIWLAVRMLMDYEEL